MSTTRRSDGPSKRKEESPAPIFDRAPPHNRDAEMGLIGSIMLVPEVCDEIATIVRADDFYDDAHAKIFRHMQEMYEAGKKVDATLLLDRLRAAGELEVVGGALYLTQLFHAVPNAAHAVYYAEIVRDRATIRGLIGAATKILRDSYDETRDVKSLVSSAEHAVFEIMDERGGDKVARIDAVLHDTMDRIEARIRGEYTEGGVNSGFTLLDEQTGGLHNNELIVLAARPSMGKTAFAMNIASNVAVDQKVPVLFISLEMSAMELTERLLCSVAEVNGHRLRNGTCGQDERQRLAMKSGVVGQAPLYIDDSPSRTISEIAAGARRVARRENRLGLIVIDYLQLIEPDNMKDPRQEQVSRMTRRLKGLAREMKVPILVLAQLNRQTEASKDNIPRLSHLRESGAIEQDADVVMFVHREEYYHRGEDAEKHAGKAQIIVAKQRNGPVGDIDLIWKKDFTKFCNAAPERYSQFDQFNDGSGDPLG